MANENDFIKKAITYGGIALLAAAAGALTWEALTADEEERPPIIVQGGSAEISIEYPDETHGSKGGWTKIGDSGKYRHEHVLSGPSPNRNRNSVFNGTCTGGSWRSGDLRITTTDGTTDKTFDLMVTGNHIQLDPGDHDVTTYGTDPSRLTLKPKDVVEPTWIKTVAPRNGGGNSKCEFTKDSRPVIRIEQRR